MAEIEVKWFISFLLINWSRGICIPTDDHCDNNSRYTCIWREFVEDHNNTRINEADVLELSMCRVSAGAVFFQKHC